MPASVLVASNINNENEIIEVTREPFQTDNENNNWTMNEFLRILLIILIVYLLIFRK